MLRTFALFLAAAALLTLAGRSAAQGAASAPLLLQQPTMNRTEIVFVYAGDLWSVPRAGGEARRLTTSPGEESSPHFSPDGTQIAFTGEYDGNPDVYTMPAEGGVPKRLTFHPHPDRVLGWTPDGASILFASDRNSYSRAFDRLFTVPAAGGPETELPLPMGEEGSFSPDGSELAYLPLRPAFFTWKRYRGGRTTPIWIARLSDSSIEKLPRDNSNDLNPMWIGDRIYFLSDREGPVTFFSYDTRSKKVRRVVKNDGLDLKSASAGPGGIVYEQFGSLHVLDLPSEEEHSVTVRLAGDLPAVRPHWAGVGGRIAGADLSPSGARAVFEARGEIFTVPAAKGDVRDLTHTPGVMERDPAWSPDGKWIAYFSDESGEYQLHLQEASGTGETRKLPLGEAPSFYFGPVWSPDSRKIAYQDKRLNLWYLDVASGASRKVDTNPFDNPFPLFSPVWSPDSQWIAYAKQLQNRLPAIFLFSLTTGQRTQVTDGMSDSRSPIFDRGGKYLYFIASTDSGPSTAWLDLSSVGRRATWSAYVTVLRKDLPSPLAPESDEEKGTPAAGAASPPAAPAKSDEPFRIDLENLDQRILSLPLPARHYVGLDAGPAETLFLIEAPNDSESADASVSVSRYSLTTRKAEPLVSGLLNLAFSADGTKLLYLRGGSWAIAPTAAPPPPTQAPLRTSEMRAWVDPPAEWRQMYHEIWRIERDYFYDPNYHGLDLKSAEARYAPYLERIASREALNDLFDEMLGEMSVGHMFVGGGDRPEVTRVPGGLLGADYAVENGRYRIARIYRGENWNPGMRAPLTEPGVEVNQGDYLLAVDGREVRPPDNVYRFFEETAGHAVRIKIGPNPDGASARETTVVPIPDETGLRFKAWIDANRRKVAELSGGRAAYVYLPDTANGGYTYFNRYFYSQIDRPCAVLDERFNGGGDAADYIIDALRRPLMNYWSTREGQDFTTPAASIYGPKVMITNEYAGSGGDALPWYFHAMHIGPLVGKRTWGGLVGIYGYPQLMDGGFVTAPRVAFWNPNGTWDVENHGVAPDIEVELDPKAWRDGHDPQLERAVQVVVAELEKHPLPKPRRPAFPSYHPEARRAAQ